MLMPGHAQLRQYADARAARESAAGARGGAMTRRARILPGPRCGGPDACTAKSVDHSPEPGTRRIWTFHDVQCQAPNPQPGPHLDG
jgi:hypothetical protein